MQQVVALNINTEREVDDLQITSSLNPDQTYAIFKHSTRCSISSMALNRMEHTDFFKLHNVPFYLLDLIQFRSVSNYIAEKFAVSHESPQMLLIKNGKCVSNVSHSDIRESWLIETIV